MPAEGFKIADSYVDIIGRIDRRAVETSAEQAGDRAGRTMGERVTTQASDAIKRDSLGRFMGAGGAAGSSAGRGFFISFSSAAASMFPKALTNPYILAAATAAGSALGPVLGAAITSSIVGGAGMGVIGLGALLLKEEPALVAAATSLKESTVSIFKTAAQPMLQPFVNALGMIEGMMGRLKPSIGKMFAAMAPAVEPLTAGLVDMVEKSMPGILAMVEAAGPMLKELAPLFGALGEGVAVFGKELARSAPAATVFLKDFLEFTGGFIAGMGQTIGWLTRGYVHMRDFFTSIPGWIQGVKDWFSRLGDSISDFFSGIGDWFSSGSSKVSGFFSGVGQTISEWINSVGAWFSALPGRIGSFLESLPGVLKTAFTVAFDALFFAIGFALGSVVKFFIDLPGRISAGLSSLWETVSTNFAKLHDGAVQMATDTAASVVGWFQGLPGRASAALSSLWSFISGHFNAAKQGAINAVTSLVNSSISFFATLPGRAASALGGVYSAVTGAFAGAGSWLYGAGQDILRGIANGITGAVGWVRDAAIRAAKGIISGFTSALGIKSPSTVMRDRVGRYLLPGAVEGIKRSLPAAQRAVADAANALIPSASGVGGGSGTGGAAYHFAPGSIVLDASKLSSIQDVIDMISGIRTSARQQYARAATAPGV